MSQKVTLYLDHWPSMPGSVPITATTQPGPKIKGIKRYEIVVYLPDPNEPDARIPPNSVDEVKE